MKNKHHQWSTKSFFEPTLPKIMLTIAFSTITIFGWITLLSFEKIPMYIYLIFILATMIIIIASGIAASWLIHASTHSRIMDMMVMQILIVLIIMLSAIAFIIMN